MGHQTDDGAVLIIFPGALGDLVCFGPALRALARRHAEQSVELMARTELARFAVGRMGVSAGHSIDRREIGALFAPAIDQEPARKLFSRFSRIYSFFAADNACFRATLAAAAGGAVSFHPFRPPGSGHVARGYLHSIGENGAGPLKTRIELLPEDVDAASGRLARMGIRAGEFALILPGSGSRAKNWPAENYAALIERLKGITPLVVIGPAEMEMRAFFESRTQSVVSGLELGEVAGLAASARCFIGNDSGASHLAAAVGALGVAIFGPTDPARWAPLGEVAIIRRREAIAAIAPDEVLAALNQIIARTARDSKDSLWRSK